MEQNTAKKKKSWIKITLISCSVLFGCACVLIGGGCITAAVILTHHLKQGGYVVDDWEDGKDGLAVFNIPYGDGEQRQYNLYLPPPALEGKYCPVLLFLHGGGWTSGQKEDVDNVCRYFARKGCITVTSGYSLVSDKHPEVLISTMLDDIDKCITSVRSQLETRGIPIGKLGIGGFSAGAHLAMLYGFSHAEESAIPIGFVISKAGPACFTADAWGKEMAAGIITLGTGTKISPDELDTEKGKHLIDSVSPGAFITSETVPAILAYGGKDPLSAHGKIIQALLEKNGVPNIYVEFPNSNHAMWDDPDKVEEFRAAILSYCAAYLPAPVSAE